MIRSNLRKHTTFRDTNTDEMTSGKLPQETMLMMHDAGLKIATDTVANATNIFSLATKNSG